MAFVDDILYIGQPAGTDTDLYTVPSDTIARITSIHICNTSATDDTISLHIVQSGDSIADDIALIKDATIPANGYLNIELGLPLRTVGDKISGIQNTATACTVTIIGFTESTL